MNEDCNGNQVNVTPKFFVSQLYASLLHDINQVFRSHFGLNDDFEVQFQYRLGIKKRTLTQNLDGDDNNDGNDQFVTQNTNPLHSDKRGEILKRMVTQVGLGTNDSGQKLNKSTLQSALHSYFVEKGITNKEGKQQLFNELCEDINEDNEDELLLTREEIMEIEKNPKGDIDIEQLYILNQNMMEIQQSIGDDQVLEIEMGALNTQPANQ